MGLIFGPENLDVVLFPEKINGQYVAFTRPVSKNLAKLNMWLASSPDLIHWGKHKFLIAVRPKMWDCERIGASAVPIRTAEGWLEIYHGATADDIYCLGALLLDINNPSKVIARSNEPILKPEAIYEVEGFLGNVIFSCGAIDNGDQLIVYYGAADHVTAAAEFSIKGNYRHADTGKINLDIDFFAVDMAMPAVSTAKIYLIGYFILYP